MASIKGDDPHGDEQFTPEQIWETFELFHADEAQVVADAAELARVHFRLPLRDAFWGRWYHVQEPELGVLVQRRASDFMECAYCGQPHPQLIIQNIIVRHPRQGHGTRFLMELVPADAPHGAQLQSTVTAASRAWARKLDMARYCPDTWEWCRRPRKTQ